MRQSIHWRNGKVKRKLAGDAWGRFPSTPTCSLCYIFGYWVPSGNLCGGESPKSRNIDNFCFQKDLMMILTSLNWRQNPLQSATEWERQLTTARANQRTGLTNGRVTNCAPEVELSPFRALSCPQLTFPSCC